MADGEESVPAHLWEYAKGLEQVQAAAEDLRRYLKELINDASLKAWDVQARAKSIASYQEKAERTVPVKSFSGQIIGRNPKYTDPAEQIEDCVAARVIFYTKRDVEDFGELLKGSVQVTRNHNPGDENHDGYDSEHYVVDKLADSNTSARYPTLADYLHNKKRRLEIQLRTAAGHAWAEYSHSVKYKESEAWGALSENDQKRINNLFIEAGGLRRNLDNAFDEINQIIRPASEAPARRDETDAGSGETRAASGITLVEFEAFLSKRYDGFREATADEVQSALHRVGSLQWEEDDDVKSIEGLHDLREYLDKVDVEEVEGLMSYGVPPTRVRRFDDDMLAEFGDDYVVTAQDDALYGLFDLRLRRLRGKYAIYQVIRDGEPPDPPLTGSAALRELVKVIVEKGSRDSADLTDVVTHTKPRWPRFAKVKTRKGIVYVNSNMGRDWIEFAIGELLSRADGVEVTRAGDPIVPTD